MYTQNEKFSRIKAQHPNWSDEQIWTAISLDMETDNVIEERGANVDRNDPIILREILGRAQEWLKEVLPAIFEKVKTLFVQIFQKISEWAVVNWNRILEFVGKYFA